MTGDHMSMIEPGTPSSEHDLDRIEVRLGRALPAEFRQFARTYGNAFVGGTIDGDEELELLCFTDLSKFGEDSFFFFKDYLDGGALPFAQCSFGGNYVLDREDRVWYALNYSGKFSAREVAPSFGTFLERIVVNE
jgi:hypothetical protein